MPSRQELRTVGQLQSDRAYLDSISRLSRLVASNPAITTRLGDRDTNTGKHFVTAANGGTLLANSITTGGGIRQGAVIPATVANGATNFIDAKPTN